MDYAFNMAMTQVRVAKVENYDVCCCAHEHDDNCIWYKFYKKYPKEAHEIHSHDCQCKTD